MLQDIVITQPNAIFEAVTDFIITTFKLDKVTRNVISKFVHLGLFKKEDVESIYNDHANNLPTVSFVQFIAILEELNLIGPTHNDEYDYFLGCAIAHAPFSENEEAEDYDPLLVIFNIGFVPNGIFSGMLSRLCQYGWEIKCDTHGKPLLYRYQATFIAHHYPVTMKATPKHIEFTVDYKPNSSVCDKYLDIRQDIDRAFEESMERLKYTDKLRYGFYCSNSECKQIERHFAEAVQNTCQCSVTRSIFNLEPKRMLWFMSAVNITDGEFFKYYTILCIY